MKHLDATDQLIVRAAVAYNEDRIAPVFDVAGKLCLVDVANGNIVDKSIKTFSEKSITQKALQLSEWDVDVLVCGAISKPVSDLVVSYNIEVISFIAGKLDEIVKVWAGGKLDSNRYAMPGCCGNRSRKRLRNTAAECDRYIEGSCICLKCGHREPHQRGLPCSTQFCPQCGFTLSRET